MGCCCGLLLLSRLLSRLLWVVAVGCWFVAVSVAVSVVVGCCCGLLVCCCLGVKRRRRCEKTPAALAIPTRAICGPFLSSLRAPPTLTPRPSTPPPLLSAGQLPGSLPKWRDCRCWPATPSSRRSAWAPRSRRRRTLCRLPPRQRGGGAGRRRSPTPRRLRWGRSHVRPICGWVAEGGEGGLLFPGSCFYFRVHPPLLFSVDCMCRGRFGGRHSPGRRNAGARVG